MQWLKDYFSISKSYKIWVKYSWCQCRGSSKYFYVTETIDGELQGSYLGENFFIAKDGTVSSAMQTMWVLQWKRAEELPEGFPEGWHDPVDKGDEG